MDSVWLALAIVMILEGIGPMLFPNKWLSFLQSLSDLPVAKIQLVGGVLVISGVAAILVLVNAG